MKRYDVQIVAKSRQLSAFPSSELAEDIQKALDQHTRAGWELHSQSMAYELGLYVCLLIFVKE